MSIIINEQKELTVKDTIINLLTAGEHTDTEIAVLVGKTRSYVNLIKKKYNLIGKKATMPDEIRTTLVEDAKTMTSRELSVKYNMSQSRIAIYCKPQKRVRKGGPYITQDYIDKWARLYSIIANIETKSVSDIVEELKTKHGIYLKKNVVRANIHRLKTVGVIIPIKTKKFRRITPSILEEALKLSQTKSLSNISKELNVCKETLALRMRKQGWSTDLRSQISQRARERWVSSITSIPNYTDLSLEVLTDKINESTQRFYNKYLILSKIEKYNLRSEMKGIKTKRTFIDEVVKLGIIQMSKTKKTSQISKETGVSYQSVARIIRNYEQK
ncbi:MAG: hypothetical protein ACRCXZ_03220 [Patescibacteria group bacterium]